MLLLGVHGGSFDTSTVKKLAGGLQIHLDINLALIDMRVAKAEQVFKILR